MLTHLVLKSRNAKVGPIPVSTSSAKTCADSCPLKAAGCYADGGPLAMHWRAVTEGKRGMEWPVFTAAIADLPESQLWRHDQAGDLPGEGDYIDAAQLAGLVTANIGRRGFTYTHKPVVSGDHAAGNRDAVTDANMHGFTVNLSANNLAHADTLAALNIGPVVVVQDATEGARHDTVTPEGRVVKTCPATYRDDVTCQSCQLCQRRDRKVIVGFPAHGMRKKAAATVARG